MVKRIMETNRRTRSLNQMSHKRESHIVDQNTHYPMTKPSLPRVAIALFPVLEFSVQRHGRSRMIQSTGLVVCVFVCLVLVVVGSFSGCRSVSTPAHARMYGSRLLPPFSARLSSSLQFLVLSRESAKCSRLLTTVLCFCVW